MQGAKQHFTNFHLKHGIKSFAFPELYSVRDSIESSPSSSKFNIMTISIKIATLLKDAVAGCKHSVSQWPKLLTTSMAASGPFTPQEGYINETAQAATVYSMMV
jgi:hypothetical protein